ncbi:MULTISPECIES: helix-turn-helix domain-containing protein [Acinetobacter]|jgi:transcriptional regulator with XRE-family HTH domain|uniref:helix-turn-helix domain-containing protein n=1 Tax=Acinetobacter TaxID=469 RepID=UPI0015BFE396|nr:MULTISPECIES: helix-turn-helix transcriptional regulator [Acinetobacter]MCO8048190.1 helix-turn-helix domain-containing protein [Acinetobacter towneri]NWK53854.1 helix-turn-helix transcriptional regulator [Acinetobacter sp. SwsAc5]
MTKSIHTDEMVALRDWLKLQRQSRHLTMRSLAQLMGKPHSYIQRVEDGERRLDVIEYVWYCNALNIDPRVGLELVLDQISK